MQESGFSSQLAQSLVFESLGGQIQIADSRFQSIEAAGLPAGGRIGRYPRNFAAISPSNGGARGTRANQEIIPKCMNRNTEIQPCRTLA